MDRRIRARVENALWGLFIGGGVAGYEAPHHPHPESFMVGMGYQPDVETARRLGRPYDILHEHVRFYQTPYSSLQIDRDDREAQHGNQVPHLNERYHYHHGLQAGENTLGAHLVRVLLRSIARAGDYHPQAFLEGFVHHLTTPGLNRDPYTEIYIRRWFERYTGGLPIEACAEQQRAVWSIGSHGGMIRPMVVSLLYPQSGYQALGMALEHQVLTHRSENVAAALSVATPLLHDLTRGASTDDAFRSYASRIHLPVVTGEELFDAYRDHNGPGNIPDDRMWRLHTELQDQPFDLATMVGVPEREAVMGTFATACYPEHGLPLMLYQSAKHAYDPRSALLANANAGGDNVHRGMVQGLLLGAAREEIPAELKDGLRDNDAIQNEIDAVLRLSA